MDINEQISELKLKNDANSLLQLGTLYSTGPLGVRDYQQAVDCFKKSADAGNSDALVRLGVLYSRGVGIKLDTEQSNHYFELAKEQGNGKAFIYGVIPEVGKTIASLTMDADHTKIIKQGRSILETQADQNDPEVIFLLGMTNKKGRFTVNPNLLQTALDKGFARAGFVLGQYYSEPDKTPKDHQKGIECYRKAIDLGCTESMVNLALIKRESIEPEDKLECLQLLNQAASLGDAKAMFILSYHYDKGELVDKDSKQAINLLEKAIALGQPEAMFNLGLMYLDGRNVAQDPAKACEILDQTIHYDNPHIMYQYGEMCRIGFKGVPVDVEKTKQFFHKAADLGYAPAMTRLALEIYGVDDEETPSDQLAISAQLLKKAVKLNDVDAMSHLASMYFTGAGVPQNEKRGRELLEQAIALGSPEAMMALAILLTAPYETPKNQARGWKLARRACELNPLLYKTAAQL